MKPDDQSAEILMFPPLPGTPDEDEAYQKFVESMVPFCRCRMSNCPCDGLLAGGPCDNFQDDDRDSVCDDEDRDDD